MRLPQKSAREWTEGVVNRDAEHISISYGENVRTVALIAQRSDHSFTVQFLLGSPAADSRAAKILHDVRAEMMFYLLHDRGTDAWRFAQYHCDTPANRASHVRWAWHDGPARV